jgi:hypothetical protein
MIPRRVSIPFALSLSKGRTCSHAKGEKEGRCFDKLSTNGGKRRAGSVKGSRGLGFVAA